MVIVDVLFCSSITSDCISSVVLVVVVVVI